MWGFGEGTHWRPRAALWNKDWTLRPHGQAWVDLVTREWWTNTNGLSAVDGKFSTRGFCGNYEIVVQREGKKISKNVQLTQKGVTLRAEMN